MLNFRFDHRLPVVPDQLIVNYTVNGSPSTSSFGTTWYYGQTFTMNNSGPTNKISKIAIKLSRNDTNPTGTLSGKLFATVDNGNGFFIPTGSALATSDLVDITSLPIAFEPVLTDFVFSSLPTLIPTVRYAFVVDFSNSAMNGGSLKRSLSSSSEIPNENWLQSNDSGTTWTDFLDFDIDLQVYASGS